MEPVASSTPKEASLLVKCFVAEGFGDQRMSGLPKACQIHATLGFPSHKRLNLDYINDDKTLLSCIGNSFQMLNMSDMKKTIIVGQNTRGIGSIAVHPTLPLFAVAEKGENPEILIYSFPELEIKHRLQKGTERTFSDMQFSTKGDKLASVGNAPDFLLTVWDWEKEVITLHTKAFAQEVYRVAFSPNAEGRLCTSGMGHIRFWKMAKTFTGLKLQGEIGKFGNVDISDISAFIELPDGRTVSGSEDGYLLMWDGNFIQFQMARKDRSPCHDGVIEFVTLEGRTLISAGKDGFVRMWDMASFEFAEVEEEDPMVCMEPKKEICIPGASVRGMMKGKDHWLVQDANGALHRLLLPEYKVETILNFHAGPITGSIPSQASHTLTTCGGDATIRCWDLITRKELFRKKLSQPCSNMVRVPESVCHSNERIMVGFKDGVVRQLERRGSRFELVHVCKPHYTEVHLMAVSPDNLTLATAAKDGTVFFSDIKANMEPIGFIELEGKQPAASICWRRDSEVLLVAAGHKIMEITRPKLKDFPDEGERRTFRIECKSRAITLDVADVDEKPVEESSSPNPSTADGEDIKEGKGEEQPTEEEDNEQEEQEVKVPPDSVAFCTYANDDESSSSSSPSSSSSNLLVCLQPPDFEGLKKSGMASDLDAKYSRVYKCSFENTKEDKPKEEKEDTAAAPVADHSIFLDAGKPFGVVSLLQRSLSEKYLLLGSHSGKVQVRDAASADTKKSFQLNLHDGDEGEVTGVSLSFDDSILSTVGRDGNLFVYRVDIEKALAGQEPEAMTLPTKIEEKLPEGKDDVEDITDPAYYSFEEAKLKKELDDARTIAEKKKEKVRKKIKELQKAFKDLLAANSALPASKRLDRSEFEIDPELMQSLRDKAEAKVQYVRDELEYASEKISLQLTKLKRKFFSRLMVEHIRLKSFSNKEPLFVSSFRVNDFSEERKKLVREVQNLLKGEMGRQSIGSQKLELPNNVPGALEYKPGQSAKDYSLEATIKSPKGRKLTGAEKRKLHADRQREILHLREKDMARLEEQKPDPTKEDPEDKKLLAYARANLGDFKLKSAPDFKVPESQRINTDKKRMQMLLLVDGVLKIKMQFNHKFLALRDLKKTICEHIRRDQVQLMAINRKLGISEHLEPPTMSRDEWPEERDKVTDADLAEFEQILLEREKAKKGKNSGFGGGDDDDEEEEEEKKKLREEQKKKAEKKDTKVSPREQALQAYRKRIAALPVSSSEKIKRRATRLILQRKRKLIQERIQEASSAFDKALRTLHVEKLRLDVDLKATDLRLLTLSEELDLLHKFEATENMMLVSRKKAIDTIELLHKQQGDCHSSLKKKRNEAEICQKEKENLQRQFDTIIEEHFQKDETASTKAQLRRIYEKKIKRKRPRDDDDENSDSDSESEEDSEDQDQCPLECPVDIYDKVLELREQRTDCEEEMQGLMKSKADLETKFKSLELKVGQVQKELSACEHDLELFQNKKQNALNRIIMNIPMRLSQIRYLDNGSMPAEIKEGLILTREQKTQLASNLVKVEQEGSQLEQKLSQLKKQCRVLKTDLKKRLHDIATEQAKCEDVQTLKFGRRIDLSILRQKTSETALEEMKGKLKASDEQNIQTLNTWDLKIKVAREKLSKVVQQNTNGLEKVGVLRKAQIDLEEKLNDNSKGINVSTEGGMARYKKERSDIAKIVKMQESEIAALNAEINVLSRKGGDIFAMQR